MCGIFGIVHYDPNSGIDPYLLEAMGKVLSHRGPDHQGTWHHGPVGLGHARLSIIDLSPLANQPLLNEDGTVILTFNGEIYNFKELREELLGKGHVFRSEADSEVVLHLWEEVGPACLDRLRGMFAFGIWDSNQKSLFLARDRLGQKPLYCLPLPDKFLFSSEPKAILQHPDVKAEPDMEAIHHYLNYQSVPAPFSAFKGVKKLPPAHYLLLKNGRGEPRPYWKLSYRKKCNVETEADLQNLQEELIDRLRESTKLRMISDVPLGAFLSGGLDSSIITALMAGLSDRPVKTFSIGFSQEEYNETRYARMVAERYGTDHREFHVTPDAREIFPQLVWHYNEPFADSSAIPTYYVSKIAREEVKVVLNGDAGDENFAGYPRYQGIETPPKENPLRSILGRLASEKKKWVEFSGSGFRKDRARRAALTADKLAYYYRITHFHEIYKASLYSDEMKERTRGNLSIDLMLDRYAKTDAKDFLDATLDLDFNLYLPDTLMVKVDIASMAHALEARSPFLDHKFVEFAATIPSNLKLKDGKVSKYILKKASEPYLPHDVIYRKKMGFGVPLDHWFREDLKELAYDLLLSQRARERGMFQPAYVESLLDRHQAGENWQSLIWNLLMLELWFLMFIDKTWPEPSRT